jgi:hypothetical protein
MNSNTSGWLVLTRNSLAGSHPQNDNVNPPLRVSHLRPSAVQSQILFSMLMLSPQGFESSLASDEFFAEYQVTLELRALPQ